MGNDLTFNIAALDRASAVFIELAKKVEILGAKLDELDHKRADPKVDVDTKEADAKLDALSEKIDKLKIDQTRAAGAGILIGASALTSAGLLAIPAAITAIGVESEKSNPVVVNAFTSMTQSAKDALHEGFSPLVPALTGFADQAKATFGDLKPAFAQSAEAAAPLVSTIGAGFLSAAKAGIGAVPPIIKGLQPVAQAAASDFGKLERGVVGFLNNIDPGPAAQGLAALGSDVEKLLPPVGRLVNDVVPLGTDLLNVVGPALTATAQDAHILAAPIQAVGSAVGFTGPLVGALTPVVLGLAGGTKLLTGSWTDFSGAAQKVLSPIQNYDSTLTSLANKIGITTAAQNAETKAAAESALAKAQLTKQAAEVAATEAADTAATVGSAEAKLAAMAAAEELTAADAALTEAEAAAATAAEGMTFSLGPIGAIVGALGLGLGLMALQAKDSSDQVEDLSQQIIKMGSSTPAAAAEMAANSPKLQAISGDLQNIGSSAQEMAHKFSGNIDTATQFTNNLEKSQKDLGNTMTGIWETHGNGPGIRRTQLNLQQLRDEVDHGDRSVDGLSEANKRALIQYDSYGRVVPQARKALDDMKAAQDAQRRNLADEGITLSQASQAWNTYGQLVGQTVTDFNSATAGIKALSDNVVAADAAFFQAKSNFEQLDQAVTQAEQSYEQAVQGVANARHSLAQAAQGVTSAHQAERQAALSVASAQHTLQQAVAGEKTAEEQLVTAQKAAEDGQKALTQARVDAAQALKDLQRQVTDQADTEAEAQLRLLDARTAANAAGLGNKTLADLGPLTATNEQQFQLLLALQEAQHNLNDVTAQGQTLAQQNATAQAAGIDGSQQVLSAQQQLTQAQQQAQQAADSLAQAQYGITQASQGVQNAQDAQTQAHLATQNAQYGEQQASLALSNAIQQQNGAAQALTQAKADDSRTTDLNSAAGVRNWQTIEDLYEKNLAATGSTQLATQATEEQGKQMGIDKDAVDGVITSITKIPQTTPFSIVGTPSLNLSALLQQASAEGISPFSLGLPSSDVQLAWSNLHGHAEGGLISGSGTGTSDSILGLGSGGAVRVSNGEYVVRASETAKHKPLLDAINAGRLSAFAGGGVLTPADLMKVNFQLAGWDATLQATSSILQAFGYATPNLPNVAGRIDFGALGVGSFGGGGGDPSGTGNATPARSGTAAQAQAYAFGRLAAHGWGPDQMPPLIKLWNQESGWNAFAVNPSSGAYGIPQSLGHGHPYNLGDYEAQVDWGEDYIQGRYRTPTAAWAHEVANNWYSGGGLLALKPPKAYDNGGGLPPGLTLAYNGTGRTENVRTGAQEDALLAELRQLRSTLESRTPVQVGDIVAGPGMSVDQLASEVIRRLSFHGTRW